MSGRDKEREREEEVERESDEEREEKRNTYARIFLSHILYRYKMIELNS